MAQRWRLPRVRFTVRRLMIVVAIVGFCVGYFAMWQRAALRRELATYHAIRAKNAKSWISDRKGGYFRPSYFKDPQIAKVAAVYERMMFFHQEMSRKWEDASRHPWLAVAPDPPEPK